MEKKRYVKPKMEVYEYEQQPRLLAGSYEKPGYPGTPWP